MARSALKSLWHLSHRPLHSDWRERGGAMPMDAWCSSSYRDSWPNCQRRGGEMLAWGLWERKWFPLRRNPLETIIYFPPGQTGFRYGAWCYCQHLVTSLRMKPQSQAERESDRGGPEAWPKLLTWASDCTGAEVLTWRSLQWGDEFSLST